MTEAYKDLEKLEQSGEIVPFDKVLEKLYQTSQEMKSPEFSLTGMHLLENKEVKNPTQLYKLLSQPLSNAIKYSEEKPFEIAIEEVEKMARKSIMPNLLTPKPNQFLMIKLRKFLKKDIMNQAKKIFTVPGLVSEK